MDAKFLENTPLFRGIPDAQVSQVLRELSGEEKAYRKGETIYQAGDRISSIGIVHTGKVRIENNDLWGNCSVLDLLETGQVFAETYACVPGEPMMVSVIAAEDTSVLFLDIHPLLGQTVPASPALGRLMQNLLLITAQKNLALSRRIFHTSAKTIRGRLLSFLSHYAAQAGSQEFTIPFNRQQLADYLSVDRSALSNELSKMQKEGLLTVQRNHFTVL